MSEGQKILSLVLQGLDDAVRGEVVDNDEVWADIDQLLTSYGVSREIDGPDGLIVDPAT